MRAKRQRLACTAGALMCSAWWIAGAVAQEAPQGVVELTLPRAAAPGEAVRLQLNAGVLPRGARILVRTRDGALVGAASPFGAPRGQATAATYTLPLPPEAIANGRVQLRLEVEEPGGAARPPRPGEVQGMELTFVRVTR